EVQYLDSAENFDQVTAIAGGLALENIDHAPVRETITLYGVTNAAEARREANYRLRSRRLVRSRVEFEMALDGLASLPGDVISIARASSPDWSWWTGRGSGTMASVKLSQPITLVSGKTYFALVRRTDAQAGQQVQITQAAGTYAAGTAITMNGSAGVSISESVIAIGEAGMIKRDYRIVAKKVTERLTCHVEAVEYVPEIYDLVGWTEGSLVKTPPTGCLDEGNHFFEFSGLPPCTPPVCTGQCLCPTFDAQVTVTGAGASCVTINRISENGISFTIAVGCAGQQFCFQITRIQGCAPCDFGFCAFTETCPQVEVCFDICA
ncbi:MAG: phage tail protein, partial [Phycisphaerales bacterium]|nr:phage tail protein [Phycisphaerales bacterium]